MVCRGDGVSVTRDQVSIYVPVHFNTAYGSIEKLSYEIGLLPQGDKAISTKLLTCQ